MDALLSFYAATGTAVHATYGGFLGLVLAFFWPHLLLMLGLLLVSSVTRRWEDEARDKLWAEKNTRR